MGGDRLAARVVTARGLARGARCVVRDGAMACDVIIPD